MMQRWPSSLFDLLLNSLSGSPMGFHGTLRETQLPKAHMPLLHGGIGPPNLPLSLQIASALTDP